MILIAESGSTKCDWVLLNLSGEVVTQMTTIGFNPFHHSSEQICEELLRNESLSAISMGVEKLFFYGAGCSSEDRVEIIKHGLALFFKQAIIEVDHDLKAAAFSTYGGVPEITCILGTGSNSVFFDGHLLREEVPSLAYILGDEGSASHIGKSLVTDFLYKKMPIDISTAFFKTFKIDKEKVLNNVYQRPHANVYLAEFSRFIGYYPEHNYIVNLLKNCFRRFIEIHVLCYPEALQSEINFVGSVASKNSEVLEQVLNEYELKMGRVVEKPLTKLIDYHLKYLKITDS